MRVKVVKMIAAVIYLKSVTFIDKIERKGYFGEYIKCKSKRKKTDVVYTYSSLQVEGVRRRNILFLLLGRSHRALLPFGPHTLTICKNNNQKVSICSCNKLLMLVF